MRKILRILLLTFCAGFLCSAAYAEVQPADLHFSPAGGGKFIYCNNQEGIFIDTLADRSNPAPTYIMNNENLSPDRYYIYASHINYTHQLDASGAVAVRGFDIELDVQLKARTDTTLVLNKIAFESPSYVRYYQNGQPSAFCEQWGSLNACATLLGTSIHDIHTGTVYQPAQQTAQTIHIPQGETVWLSAYIPNYSSTAYVCPVFLAADLDVLSGRLDINVAAFRATDILGDRSQMAENPSFGVYRRDRCQKGVADTLPEVNADLSYTIDDTTASGTALPVTVYNQYVPEGNTVEQWCTHLNPQDDIWSKQIAAESDMLTYRYYDPSKRTFYGKNIPASERDDVWIFDTRHSDTRAYDAALAGRVAADDYIPNYPLDVNEDNHGFGSSLGNYGVSERYHLTIRNDGNTERYFQYQLSTKSNVIVAVRSTDEELLAPVRSKGSTDNQNPVPIASVALPPQTTTSFILEVILPVNYVGGVKNAFQIVDEDITFPAAEVTYTPAPKAVSGSPLPSDSLSNSPDAEVRRLFPGKLENYEILKTGTGYMVRWCAWDGNPNFQSTFWDTARDVYFLDQNFCITGKYTFPRPPLAASYAKGRYYIRTVQGGAYVSANGTLWQPYSDDGQLPLDNGSLFAAKYVGGVCLSTDGQTFLPAAYQIVSPSYIAQLDDLYYYTKGNAIGYSYDGVYWYEIDCGAPVEEIVRTGSALLVNGQTAVSLVEKTAPIYVCLNGEYLGFDQPPVLENDRTLVPMRFLFEKLQMEVEWDETTRTATARRDGLELAFTIDNPVAYINGQPFTMDTQPRQINWRTLVPLRFISETLGYSVGWDGDTKLVTITTDGI